MGKINVAELLKGCPSGMELDCTMYENLYFDSLNADYYGTINCYTLIDGIKTSINLTKYGTFNNHPGAKCVIYPKGKTTWEGFQRPFKDGDILATELGSWVGIIKNKKGNAYYDTYCTIGEKGILYINDYFHFFRFATEEEKEKLFQAIKDNGYKWNEETKTLEKLIKPKFKVGDRVRPKNTPNFITTINDITEDSYWYGCSNAFWIDDQDQWELVPMIEPKFKIGDKIKEIRTGKVYTVTDIYGCNEHISFQVDNSDFEISFKFQDKYELVPDKFDNNTLEKLVEPKFKVGDRIRRKNSNEEYTIISISDYTYYYRLNEHCTGSLRIQLQDDYELVPNKFDINTLVPFESRVLVRNDESQYWMPAFWGCKRSDGYITTFGYGTTFGWCKYCIPFDGNEHLLGTNDDCDDFYKNL